MSCRVDGIVQFPECIGQLVTELMLKNGCQVKGQFFGQTRRAVIALEYLDDAYQVFKSACKRHKVSHTVRIYIFIIKTNIDCCSCSEIITFVSKFVSIFHSALLMC